MNNKPLFDPDLLEACYEEENRSEIVDALYSNLKDGMTFTLTPKDIAYGDHFLIFSAYDKQVITIHMNRVPWWLEFDADEPMRLEDCPTSFYRTLLKNIQKGNYEITERIVKK